MITKIFSITSALAIAASLSVAQVASNAKGTLKDIQESARAATDEAEQLEQFIANPVYSWESHLDRLMALKNEVKLATSISVACSLSKCIQPAQRHLTRRYSAT